MSKYSEGLEKDQEDETLDVIEIIGIVGPILIAIFAIALVAMSDHGASTQAQMTSQSGGSAQHAQKSAP